MEHSTSHSETLQINAAPGHDSIQKKKTPVPQTTPREQQVLTLLAAGHSSRDMGEILGLSSRTIERHRANLLKKFQQKNSISLIQAALQQGTLKTHHGKTGRKQ